MKRFIGLAVVCLLIAGVIISCGTPPQQITMRNVDQFDQVVATANTGYRLTLPQLYRAVALSKAEYNGGMFDSSRVRRFLDSILVDSLIGLEAHQVKLDSFRNSWRTFHAQRRTVLVNKYVQTNVYDILDLDSANVIEFYNTRSDLFSVPELARIYHLSVSMRDLRWGPDSALVKDMSPKQLDSAARSEIFVLYDQISGRESFMDLVERHSGETVPHTRAGDLGWTQRNQYLDPYDSVAFSLDSGAYSQPYADANGWNILYCDGRIQAGIPPIDDTLFAVAQTSLRSFLANQRAPRLADSLDKLTHLEFREDGLLDSNVYLVDRDEWAAIINGRDTLYIADLRGLEEKYRRAYTVDNTSADMKRDMARELAGAYVTTRAAEDQGLDTLPDMKRLLDSLYHVYQKGILLRDLEPKRWTPSDSAIAAYYNAHIDQYQFEKPMTVQQIVVGDSIFADFVRDQAAAGYEFMELAAEYHQGDSTAYPFLAANLGEIGPDDVPQDIYRALRSTPAKVPSYPFQSDYGWHIFKVLERRKNRSLLDATGQIKLILTQQKERETFQTVRDSLYEKYDVSTADNLPPFHLPPLTERQSALQ